jgi:iron complex transport system substrate-binding protein
VLTRSTDYLLPAHQTAYEEAAKVGDASNLDLEAIALLHPDLIVGITAPWALDVYEQLTRIAPTALFDYTVPQAWIALSAQFADAVGQTPALDTLIASYKAKATELKSAYANSIAATKWGLPNFGVNTGEWRLYLPDSNPGTVLAEAGIHFVAAADRQTGSVLTYSYEQINRLADADVLLTWADNLDGKPNKGVIELIGQPTWQTLKAVEAGHFYASAFLVPGGYGEAMALLGDVERVFQQLSQ